jgi:protein tyrosine/serine phosphatase
LKWFSRIGLAVAVIVLSGGAYTGYQHVSGNFHEIIAGQYYRSGQLTAPQLEDVVRQYGIKTIINLRGKSERDWYRDEIAASTRLGVGHLDFKMSARKELTLVQVDQLTAMMRDAPKPLLVHCQAGADRTGLASVIYLNRIAKVGEVRAELQLSPLYGHFGIPYLTGTYAMDRTWHAIEAADKIEASGT